ncbi:MAG: Rho termination factor N-terminal domain-containing protein, partial [Pseudomonadota bacterium]
MEIEQLKLSELKAKSPTALLAFAEELEVEGASALRRQ